MKVLKAAIRFPVELFHFVVHFDEISAALESTTRMIEREDLCGGGQEG